LDHDSPITTSYHKYLDTIDSTVLFLKEVPALPERSSQQEFLLEFLEFLEFLELSSSSRMRKRMHVETTKSIQMGVNRVSRIWWKTGSSWKSRTIIFH
jgi:hypothetical protein